MAFIDFDKEDPAGYSYFYNVTNKVGIGCTNLKEDVMLVQYFLQKIYSHEKMKSWTPKGAMKVDGICGPVTRNWILKFQLDCRRAGVAIYADGIVDRAGNAASNWETSITRTKYTIRLISNNFRGLYPVLFQTLPYNPEVPGELRLAFLKMYAELNME